MFDQKTYVDRRNRLVSQLQGGLVLLLGNEESPMNYADNTYRFRQDSTFLYFFGLDQPHLAGIIDIDEGRQIIFGDELTIDDIVWMGSQPTLSERAAQVGIHTTLAFAELAGVLNKALAAGRTIHFIPQVRADSILKISDYLGIEHAAVNGSASVALIKAIVEQRNVKSDEEIAEIEKAVDTSVEMHLTAMRMIRPGMSEAEVAAAVHQKALAAGGDIAFPIIATIHGETLHNHYHGNTLKSGDLFLLDAGAESGLHYAGDLSSTIPVDKTFTARQKEIYQITTNAHQVAVDALRPGVKFLDIYMQTCRAIAAGLRDLGLMRGDVDEAVQQGAHALFFPCGLGHMMGLDVHDMENLGEEYVGYSDDMKKSTQFGFKSLRLARELKPGFVLTIEPGIYFIPQLIDLWGAEKRFADFINYDKVLDYKDFGGIRNEEDFVITPDGSRLLGKPLPKTIAEVESIR